MYIDILPQWKRWMDKKIWETLVYSNLIAHDNWSVYQIKSTIDTLLCTIKALVYWLLSVLH